MNQQEYIYIVFIKAMTGLGRFSRAVGGFEYTHVAVSLDKSLTDFVTFSRKKHHSPFQAGFMHEKREHYAFGKHEFVKVKVFQVPVSLPEKRRIQAFVNRVEKDKDYVFNLYSMITMPIVHGIPIYKTYNCMSFVGRILTMCNAVDTRKKYYQYDLKEMEGLLKRYFYKEGYLYKRQSDDAYMQPIGFVENAKAFLWLNGTLMDRAVRGRKALH